VDSFSRIALLLVVQAYCCSLCDGTMTHTSTDANRSKVVNAIVFRYLLKPKMRSMQRRGSTRSTHPV
jgi:hypothetical protein